MAGDRKSGARPCQEIFIPSLTGGKKFPKLTDANRLARVSMKEMLASYSAASPARGVPGALFEDLSLGESKHVNVIYLCASYHRQQNKWNLHRCLLAHLQDIYSILAVANLLAHNNISQICYCCKISL